MISFNNLTSYKKKKRLVLAVTICLLIIVTVSSCFVGIANVTFWSLLETVLPNLPIVNAVPLDNKELLVLMQLRLPRIIMAIISGASLAISGLVMQSITGNKMASPFTTGLSNAAAFGASLAIIYKIMPGGGLQIGTVMMAFVFSFVCAALVYGISFTKGMGKTTIILIGIALNYLFSALNGVMQYIADEHQLVSIMHWTFGSFTGATWNQIIFVVIVLIITIPIIWRYSWKYNLLSTGDESAIALGVNVFKLRLISGIFITLISATIVSFTGVIGFVGLVAPHISRLLIGGDFRTLMPLTALIGAILLITADTVGRIIISPIIIPVGIIVSFIGVPVFIYLIIKEEKERL